MIYLSIISGLILFVSAVHNPISSSLFDVIVLIIFGLSSFCMIYCRDRIDDLDRIKVKMMNLEDNNKVLEKEIDFFNSTSKFDINHIKLLSQRHADNLGKIEEYKILLRKRVKYPNILYFTSKDIGN